jgi:hypothetical protein
MSGYPVVVTIGRVQPFAALIWGLKDVCVSTSLSSNESGP